MGDFTAECHGKMFVSYQGGNPTCKVKTINDPFFHLFTLLKKNFMTPFYGWRATTEWKVYFLPFRYQKFWYSIDRSQLKGWVDLKVTYDFEPGTLGLGIQHLNY